MACTNPSALASVEVAIGPHSSRQGWCVLRVTFTQEPEHQARISRALDVLMAPVTRDEAHPGIRGASSASGIAEGRS